MNSEKEFSFLNMDSRYCIYQVLLLGKSQIFLLLCLKMTTLKIWRP